MKKYYSHAKNVMSTHDRHHDWSSQTGLFFISRSNCKWKNITRKQKMLCPRMTDIMIDHHKLGSFSFPGATVNEKYYSQAKNVMSTHDRHHDWSSQTGLFFISRSNCKWKNITRMQKMLCPRMTDIMIDHEKLCHLSFSCIFITE